MSSEIKPLLSDGLRTVLQDILKKHSCKIVSDLIQADDLTIALQKIQIVSNFGFCADELPLSNNKESWYNTTENLILSKINCLINDEARMLSFRHNSFEISYLPKDKPAIYTSSGNWSRENRICAKPARIIQKLLVNKYSCKEFEDFTNWFKSAVADIGEFKFVSGEDIVKYYNENTYGGKSGTLNNSCMRYDSCADYFDVYKDHAQLLILLKNDKLLGRAIAWTINDKVYIDRIYTCYDYLVNSFVEYCESNKYYHLADQCAMGDSHEALWLCPEDGYSKPTSIALYIQLSKVYEFMPYMDSFRYYNADNNYISTCRKTGQIFLSETQGEYITYYEKRTCSICGYTEWIHIDDTGTMIVHSELENKDMCRNCCTYIESISDFVSNTAEMVNVYATDDSYYEEYPMLYIEKHSDDFIKTNDRWHYKV